MFLAEDRSKVLGGITFINYYALLFVSTKVDVNKEQRLLTIIF
jgi:hypothetical protein